MVDGDDDVGRMGGEVKETKGLGVPLQYLGGVSRRWRRGTEWPMFSICGFWILDIFFPFFFLYAQTLRAALYSGFVEERANGNTFVAFWAFYYLSSELRFPAYTIAACCFFHAGGFLLLIFL